jgi:uncharacterized membrane protein
MMTARLRKAVLTVHVTCSVGWIGAVAGFLALAVAGLTSADSEVVRAAYRAMELITWSVIAPAALASLLTGVVSSLGTGWGLLRYYWVVVKLLLTLFSTLVLVMHLQPIRLLAAARSSFGADLEQTQSLMVVASSAAVLALLVLTGLSIYKPRGLTPYGARKSGITSARRPPGDGTGRTPCRS